jgi:hypothetical protein
MNKFLKSIYKEILILIILSHFSFYMPHGLTIDSESNIWLTDVAMHQVFKYNFRKSQSPLLTLGEAFHKGDDQTHFCKPTSIAVSQLTLDIFVADGYCNRYKKKFSTLIL